MKKLVAACMMAFAQLSEHWQLKPGPLKLNSEAVASSLFRLICTKFSLDWNEAHTDGWYHILVSETTLYTTCMATYNHMQYMLQHMIDPALVLPPHAGPDPQFRERKLTPVMSGQVRELTGKMLIPNSRIRLMDTLGHGKVGVYLVWM